MGKRFAKTGGECYLHQDPNNGTSLVKNRNGRPPRSGAPVAKRGPGGDFARKPERSAAPARDKVVAKPEAAATEPARSLIDRKGELPAERVPVILESRGRDRSHGR